MARSRILSYRCIAPTFSRNFEPKVKRRSVFSHYSHVGYDLSATGAASHLGAGGRVSIGSGVKRRIFVGSSTEGLDKAQRICELLSDKEETECTLWTSVFEPGFLAFEALETMLLECCAAVFIASPDDESTIRGRRVKVPRSNVMLEFGLVAGRIGRHNIALCQYGGAELPSDLKGLTVIEMDPRPSEQIDGDSFRNQAEERLRIWTSGLSATADMVARTDIVHGYTGRWDFELRLQKWRNLLIVLPSYAHVNGSFDLFMSAGGQIGRGFAHGRVFFKLMKQGAADHSIYQGEYRTAHEITNAFCHKNGSIDFTTQAFVLQRMNSIGIAPPELEALPAI
jgi:predicted nucleotide-binding protein